MTVCVASVQECNLTVGKVIHGAADLDAVFFFKPGQYRAVGANDLHCMQHVLPGDRIDELSIASGAFTVTSQKVVVIQRSREGWPCKMRP